MLFFEAKPAQFMEYLPHFIRSVGAVTVLHGLYFAATRCIWLCALCLGFSSRVQWRP